MTNNELLHVVSILMQYPSQENVQFVKNDLKEMMNESTLHDNNHEVTKKLQDFITFIDSKTIDDLQDLYVRTFDFNEKTNLYLTYSKLKEEKERGGRLVQLKQTYIKAGFVMDTEEMPDYFPLFVEFLTIAKEEVAMPLIKQFEETIMSLKEELRALESPYTNLIEAYLLLTQNGLILFDREVE